MAVTKCELIKDYTSQLGEDDIIDIEYVIDRFNISKSYLYRTLSKLNIELPREARLKRKKKMLLGKSVKSTVNELGYSDRHLYNFNHIHKLNKYSKIQPERNAKHNTIKILLTFRCLSYSEIALLVGCGICTVCAMNKRYEIRDLKADTASKHETVLDLIALGTPYSVIAKATGYSESNICKIKMKYKNVNREEI